VADNYRKLIPTQATADCRRVRDGLMHEFSNVSFCDFNALNLPPDHFFDGNHVNRNGAKIVTTVLADHYGEFFPIKGRKHE
jgi:hypothetical protein